MSAPGTRPRAAGRLDDVLAAMRRCRVCAEAPAGAPLPHEPRPVFQVSATARLAICSQAPGNLAHRHAKPFSDPSGVRLRAWLGLDEGTFYDPAKVAIIPMGFCFPGYDRNGGDLPPRRECVATWHDSLFSALPEMALRLCIGKHALAYHLPETKRMSLTDTVRDWRAIAARTAPRTVLALPHPSWRNNGWLARHPWFEAQVLPDLRERVDRALAGTGRAERAAQGRDQACG